MRSIKILFVFMLFCGAVSGPLYYYYYVHHSSSSNEQLFEVETPVKKTIKQAVSATGKLKLKDQIKVGSVVTGRVKALHVEENDTVKEGQLLAEIDVGLGDTEVREAEGAYEKALAEKEYHEASYQRKKQLFDEEFLSDAELQEAKRNYMSALADVKALKASYDKKLIEFGNQMVYAPSSGIVIKIDVAKGEKVTSDLEGGHLMSLVPDIYQIEAELRIDEKDIGQVKPGQKVEMVVDTYPNKVFKSTLHKVSFAAKEDEEKGCSYQSKVSIDNPNLLLRPGMSVTATVDIAAVESALTVTSRAFLIKKEHLEEVAALLSLPIHTVDTEKKEALAKEHQDEPIQYLWEVCDDCFKEVPICIGITDNISYEVKSGLNGDEKLVVDVMETDEMHKLYEKIYRKL